MIKADRYEAFLPNKYSCLALLSSKKLIQKNWENTNIHTYLVIYLAVVVSPDIDYRKIRMELRQVIIQPRRMSRLAAYDMTFTCR